MMNGIWGILIPAFPEERLKKTCPQDDSVCVFLLERHKNPGNPVSAV
jgi:hypothetical protein